MSSSLLLRLFGDRPSGSLTIPGLANQPPATVEPPPSFVSLRPPPARTVVGDAAKRVDPQLAIWGTMSEIPRHARCVSDGKAEPKPGGVDFPPEFRRQIVLFHLRPDDGNGVGAGSFCLGWSNREEDADAHVRAVSWLRQRNVIPSSRVEVPLDLIEVLNFGNASTSGTVVQTAAESSEAVDTLIEFISRAASLGSTDVHLLIDSDQAQVLFRRDHRLELYKVLKRETAVGIALATHNLSRERDSTHFNISKPVTENGKLLLTCRREKPEGGTLEYDQEIRWGSAPTSGENFDIVFRLLGSTVHASSFVALGFDVDQDQTISSWLELDAGLIAICGTTGSGKSTTLKTAMELIIRDRPGDAVHTIESPVEYGIAGARQRHVTAANPFDQLVRQEMRMDPDVIMIGEVRDHDTATAMARAVATGHLVLSTVHAADQFTLMGRLIDLGVERSMLAGKGFLAGLIHQRLVPLLCPQCSAPVEAELPEHRQRLLATYFGSDLSGLKVPRHDPKCPTCKGRGTKGSTVLASLVQPDFELLELIRRDQMNLARLYVMSNQQQSSLKIGSDVLSRTTQHHAMVKMRAGLISALELKLEHELSQGEAATMLTKLRLRGA